LQVHLQRRITPRPLPLLLVYCRSVDYYYLFGFTLHCLWFYNPGGLGSGVSALGCPRSCITICTQIIYSGCQCIATYRCRHSGNPLPPSFPSFPVYAIPIISIVIIYFLFYQFVAVTQPINALAFIFDGINYGASDFAYSAYSMASLPNPWLLPMISLFGFLE